MTTTFDRLNNSIRSGSAVKYSPDPALQQVTYGQPQIAHMDMPGGIGAATRLVIADTSAGGFIATMPPVASFQEGEILEIIQTAASIGPLTVTQDAADPAGSIDGFDSVLVDAADILYLQRINDLWRVLAGNLVLSSGTTAVLISSQASTVIAEAIASAGFALGVCAVAPGTLINNAVFGQVITPASSIMTFATGAFTIAAAGAGVWNIKAQVSMTALGATVPQEVGLFIRKAGASLPGNGGYAIGQTNDGTETQLALSAYATETLVPGDIIDLGLSSLAGADSATIEAVTFTLTRQ